MLPERKQLPHNVPLWVKSGEIYFITICTAPKGRNQLCRPELATWLMESMQFVQSRGDWWIYLVLLMPDHLHALMNFAREPGILKSISQWKRYVSRERKIQWQKSFFEHRLRNDDEKLEKAMYIRMNPVRAGLVTHTDEWMFVWPMEPAR
jgi:putative transposase